MSSGLRRAVSIAELPKHDDVRLQRIGSLRYEIYVGEMGCGMEDADHGRRVIIDDIDRCSLLVVAEDEHGAIVGGARNTLLSHLRASARPAFDQLQCIFHWTDSSGNLAGLSFSSKLAVSRDHRSSTVAVRLASYVYERRHSDGTSFDYLLAPVALASMYMRLGYVACAAPLTHPEAGATVPMRLDIRDVETLHRLRSPFARAVRGRRTSGAAATPSVNRLRFGGERRLR